ncbi:DNA polymerase III subunit beta [Anaerobacillus sp. 1_MG-2023]|uniref:DNA polymerase III subunit beta n=1 Tax=Anaerobacillus sp. 1_MG-2023 TaxID=3062655 RepID=UPI0026E3FE3A|nr:DNA polymerase III subunit beta [Anaerobacillus sp. 1_MG-2023]MDO6657392.1 DNA polymerase III subunit beta [Anaerobacillus sp. 1_MG-2023]
MKFEINRDLIVEGLNKVCKVVSAKASLPILQGVLFEVDVDEIRLTGSDADETIVHSIPVDGQSVSVIDTGKTVIPRQLLDILKRSRKQITFSLDGFQTTITSGKSEFELNCLDPEEYPKFPEMDEEQPHLVLSGERFSSFVKKTAFATSKVETRPVLTGVSINIKSDCIELVSTDSHRLGKLSYQRDSKEEFNIVVPAKALENCIKIFDSKLDVELIADEQMILLKNGETKFLSRLLDGNYPDTSRLIPDGYKADMRIARKEFLDSIEHVKEIANVADNGKGGVVKLHVNGVAALSSHQAQTGKGRVETVYNQLEGEDEFTINFSAKFLIEALRAFDCDEVSFLFQGDMKPFLLKPTEKTDVDEVQLILPVRTY